MKKSTIIKLGLGIVGGAAMAGEVIRRTHVRNSLRISRWTERSVHSVIEDISHIEREPALIPYVESIDIIERASESVRYTAKGSAAGVPFLVEYTKEWNFDRGIVEWRSERGSYGLKNQGSIRVYERGGRTQIELNTDFSIGLPVIGALEEEVVRPFLVHAFGTWLDHLAKE
jgi:hypothetical protein